jgi:peptidoglycan hydrolase FlgJ
MLQKEPEMIDPLMPAARPLPPGPDRDAALHRLAQEMETAFLSEMLGHAGLDAPQESFGGGIGEEQFGSFLREQQADAMVRAGGIGLAESLFRAMTRGSHAKE